MAAIDEISGEKARKAIEAKKMGWMNPPTRQF
jgi:hypothetical protein